MALYFLHMLLCPEHITTTAQRQQVLQEEPDNILFQFIS